jgi:hypothetical protein
LTGRYAARTKSASIGAVQDGIFGTRKISKYTAKDIAEAEGIDFSKDFYTLSSSEQVRLVELAKMQGYRKSKNAPGSLARMYFYHLQKIN